MARGAGDDTAAARTRKLAVAEQHPDVVLIAPEGRSLRRQEAEVIVMEGSRSPIEGSRKVIVVDRFHAAEPEAAASLLKTIEEPPPTAVFVLLSEEIPPEHVTIASRCLRIDFPPIGDAVLIEHLMGRGVEAERAATIAVAARGSLDRAELLSSDERFVARRDAWRSLPAMFDGTGARVAELVANLRALIDDAQLPLESRHAAELADVQAWEQQFGTRGFAAQNDRGASTTRSPLVA